VIRTTGFVATNLRAIDNEDYSVVLSSSCGKFRLSKFLYYSAAVQVLDLGQC